MNTRHILLCLALSLLGAGLQAQTDLPQVFSPNAAELGKYGKIPVSYFNGLPNITIPLTELRAKNYTLPIYLTYHAGGNKPDQHPGWVGLGWTLHAGGCINRIVNDKIDELCQEEQASLNSTVEYGTITSIEDPGFLYQGHLVQGDTIIRQNDEPQKERMSRAEYRLLDKEPDEFQVCVDGMEASFYVTGDGDIRIKSKGAVDFTARIILSDNDNNLLEMYPSTNVNAGSTYWTRVFRYIREIDLVSAKGVKYVFGGDWDSIEVSSSHLLGPAYDDNGHPVWQTPIGHVNTWHLREMVFPDGERISFEYEQAGIPIVKSGCFNSWRFTYAGETYPGFQSLDEQNYDTYTFLFPCYLKRVTGSMNGESVLFHSGKTTELEYDIDEQEMSLKTGAFTEYHPFSQFTDENYYRQLNAIEGNQGRVLFQYSHCHGQRLRLETISLAERGTTISRGRYEFHYNENGCLPKYNSRKTDMWGYYRGASYSMFLPQRMNQSRTPSPDSTKVGILEKIIYPTGGYTAFEYEQNDYSAYIGDDPTQRVISSGMGGGLRIKRITDHDGSHTSSRSFLYRRDSGESAGTLSGIPKFYYLGTFVRNETRWNEYQAGVQQPFWYNAFNLDDDEDGLEDFEIGSEQHINELSLTDGSHVTYDQVEEVFDDGSKVVRKYQSYVAYPDDAPRILFGNFDGPGLKYRTGSRELSRGLLSEEKYIDSSGKTVRLIHNEYNDIQTDPPLVAIAYVKYGAGYFIHRHYYYPVYSYNPYLRERTEIQYSDDGCDSLIVTTDYTYDIHRNLTEVTRMAGGVRIRDTYTYTGDYTEGEYSGMTARNMISFPVEHLQFRKEGSAAEKLTGAELVTWRSSGNHYIPSEQWQAGLGSGIASGSFGEYTGTRKDSHYGNAPELSYACYDSDGNLILSEDKTGSPTTYIWTPDGCHPAAIIPGARIPYERRDSSDVSRSQQSDLAPGDFLIKDFDCSDPFTMNLSLTCPQGQNWYLDVLIDGGSHPLAKINSTYTQSEWSDNGYGQYPSQRQVSIPSGTHRLRVNVRMTYYAGQSSDPEGCTLSFNYREKQYTTTVVPGQTVVFEDFEEDGNVTSNGYWSDRSHRGTWTHSLDTSGGPYVVDYRVFRNGRWEYKSVQASGTSVSINEGSSPIDHVRIYPGGSLPESYTWNDGGTLRSKTDARGTTESYRYDGLGRLTGVYDNEGHKVEGYQYNYKNR